MSAEERAARLRFLAAFTEMHAARLRLAAAAVETTESLRRFSEAWQGGMDDELAEHPDMAELNVRMDALYDQP